MVTFSQLLVKAHTNEEEEITSKLVNKGAVMENTLEERVDRLIAKSNQRQPPNTSFQGNPDTTMGGTHSHKTKGQKEILPQLPRTTG